MSPRKTSRDDDALAQAWHELMGRYHNTACKLDRELEAGHGISGSDFEVLQQLHDAGPDHSQKINDLANGVHLSQSALSRLVARLENDGLVERTLCVSDRRCVYASLTVEGKQRYLDARPTQRAVLREFA